MSTVFIGYFIVGFGFSIAFTMYYALMPELFTALEYEIGYPINGIASSLTQYLVKVGETLNNVAISAVLLFGHYNAALTVQKGITKLAIRFNISLVPGIVGVLALICVYLLDLEKIYPKIQQVLTERRGATSSSQAIDA